MKKNKYKLIGTALVILFLFSVIHYSKKISNENASVEVSLNQEDINREKNIALKECIHSKLVGEWYSVEDGKVLKLKNDCSFENEKCDSSGKFTDSYLKNKIEKILLVTKQTNNLPNCPPIGNQECNYLLSSESNESVLAINCNDNLRRYSNQNLNLARNNKSVIIDSSKDEKIKNAYEENEKNKLNDEEDSDHDFGIGSSTQSSSMIDGISKEGAKKCYYSNLPLITASKGNFGKKYWSSSNLDKKLKDQFKTNSIFNIRIVTRKFGNELSTFNKKCSERSFFGTKLKVKIRAKTTDNPTGEVATLISRIDRPSSVWNFSISSSDNQQATIEVIDVKSNSRCIKCKKSKYLDLQSGEDEGVTKECAAFDIQFATDSTFDLPGKRVNKLLYQ